MAVGRCSRQTFSKSHAILCESPTDEAFLRALLRHKRLPEVCIRYTGEANIDRTGGIDQFGKLLEGIPTWDGFFSVTDLLIVADTDLDPARNFEKIQKALADARPFGTPPTTYRVPTRPRVKIAGAPAVMVLMVPWEDQPGNLERLCLAAAMSAAGNTAACVDTFAQCAGVNAWANSIKRDAMKLRSVLAAQHQKNPFIGIGKVWQKNPALIPIDHASFKGIEDVLTDFCS